jgi:hypothetical protein
LRHGRCFAQVGMAQPVAGGIVVEKMHLCLLDSGGENSIVAPQQRRNNFLFAGIE